MSEDAEVSAGGLQAPAEHRMHDGMPILRWCSGEPVPDLGRIAKARWLEVLRPLSPLTRRQASAGLGSLAEVRLFAATMGELLLQDADRSARATDAPPPAMPGGALPENVAGRQVNFRLGPSEHARLLEAAAIFAMRPTTLARVLTMRGVERALYEERRDR